MQVINNDLSQLVQKNGYFGSYNTAFDPYLRQISGADAAEVKGGPWLGYWTTARAQLFRRDQSGRPTSCTHAAGSVLHSSKCASGM